jgi:hypothetical protein
LTVLELGDRVSRRRIEFDTLIPLLAVAAGV